MLPSGQVLSIEPAYPSMPGGQVGLTEFTGSILALQNAPRTIIGYHGCSQEVAERIFAEQPQPRSVTPRSKPSCRSHCPPKTGWISPATQVQVARSSGNREGKVCLFACRSIRYHPLFRSTQNGSLHYTANGYNSIASDTNSKT